MSKYHIVPEDISSTLKTTGTTADGLSKDLQPLSGYASSAASACGKSGAIVPALNGLFEHESQNLSNLATHIKACLSGAAAATTAYVDGDLDMMRTYQNNAAKGTVSKIPKSR